VEQPPLTADVGFLLAPTGLRRDVDLHLNPECALD
jgi:hypothetical protein